MTVSQALSADVYKTVDVVAKVMNKQHNTQLIHKLGKQLMKADCIIADNTESIKLVLWQDLINKVECGKTYLFQDLKVRVFDDAKYLNTNESTAIKLSEQEIQEINLTSDELKDNLIERQCVGVHFRKEKACVVCNNTLEKKDDGEEMVTCNSCNSTMLYTFYKQKLVSNLMIKTTQGKMQSYTCFNDGIQSFLASIDNFTDVDEISQEELQKLFLHAGSRKMIVDSATNVIDQFLY